VAEVGLFPLGIVLVPGERIPLHIFEERYKELIGECLESAAPFGFVYSDHDGVRAVGTLASVVRVLHRHSDGRLDIVVEGGERFRVAEITEARAFITAEIEDYPDQPDDPPEETDVAECLRAWRRLAEAADAEAPDLEAEREGLAFRIAATIDFGVEIKQDVLELRSERARLARLTDVMDDAVASVLLERRIRKRAGGNGQFDQT
jgi:Lon protease-like protein